MWKLEFWKLGIKFGNRNFEELFWEWNFGKLNFESWNLEKLFWEWNFEKLKNLEKLFWYQTMKK